MNTRPTSSRPVPPANLCDRLEPRQLMAAFASVGLDFDPTGPHLNSGLYAVEGNIASDGGATGDMYFATTSGRQKSAGLPYSSITRLADGRFVRSPNRGYRGVPTETNGAQFLTADKFAAGWWFGQYGSSHSNDLEFTVERATNSTITDLSGSWRFSLITANLNTDHYINGSGTLDVTGSLLKWNVDRGDVPYNVSTITTANSDGRFVSAQQEYFYLSADKKTLLFVDMNRADGIAYVGVAVRIDTAVTSQTMSGKGYFLAWLWSQTNGNDFSTEANARQTFLELEPDGDYKIYDLDLWDDGNRDEYLEKGFWSVSSGILTLDQDKSDEFTKLVIVNNGANVLMLSEGLSGDPDATLALGTSAVVPKPPPTSPQQYLTVSALDANGRPAVFELGVDGIWRVTDLLTKPGGPQLLATPVSWIDQKDFKLYAAGISNSGVILYTQDYEGGWSYRNLTTESTGQVITSALQTMVSPDKLVTITGLDADGNVLRYYQDGTKLANPADYKFLFANISTGDLDSQGLATPAFVGKLVSYATSWGGLNIAGLDAAGNIWSVWWAPGLAKWTVSNLTEITGAAKLTGGLTVYLTSWSGINIAGLDADSHLQVAWWVPSFGGDWKQSDLSAETAGGTATKFRASTVTSYVSSWDGLNIAGIDDFTGELRVFWWAPARVNDGWAITSLSSAVPAGSPAITRDTTGSVGLDNSLNVFGYTATSQFIRYYWLPGGNWSTTNLTTTAVAR